MARSKNVDATAPQGVNDVNVDEGEDLNVDDTPNPPKIIPKTAERKLIPYNQFDGESIEVADYNEELIEGRYVDTGESAIVLGKATSEVELEALIYDRQKDAGDRDVYVVQTCVLQIFNGTEQDLRESFALLNSQRRFQQVKDVTSVAKKFKIE